ncbi:MAG TPA: hypothetical protein VGD60_07985 [Candidatus Acidoferrales bacterium]
MTTFNIFRGVLSGAAFCAILAISAPAQAQTTTSAPAGTFGDTTTTNVAAPIVVRETPSKAVWLRAEVVHADSHTIIVRDEGNAMLIHTFTYSEKAQNKMNQILDNGGYQSGDKVRIRWIPGGSEALDIKGRPSPAQ